jgi:hypothetical protein
MRGTRISAAIPAVLIPAIPILALPIPPLPSIPSLMCDIKSPVWSAATRRCRVVRAIDILVALEGGRSNPVCFHSPLKFGIEDGDVVVTIIADTQQRTNEPRNLILIR